MSNSIEGVKFDICCAARALYRAGLSAGIAGHLSVAIGENKMLMNRFGSFLWHTSPSGHLHLRFQRQSAGARSIR